MIVILGITSVVLAKKDDKVYICHYDGRSGNYQTLYIDEHAADEHLEEHSKDYKGKCEEEASPSPSASPEASPEATPEASPEAIVPNDPSDHNAPEAKAPTCPNGETTKVVANPQVARNSDKATVTWFRTEGDNASIYYKEVNADNWQHSVRDIKTTDLKDDFVSVTINGLDPNLGYTFGIEQKSGCGGGETIIAGIIDGPATQIFNLSFYEWGK